MGRSSINRSLNLSQSLQTVHDNVNKRRYATSETQLAFQCHLVIYVDLFNPIAKHETAFLAANLDMSTASHQVTVANLQIANC